MPIPEELSRKAEEVLKQIAELGPMRKGSLCWRVLKRKTKKGETRERGPYLQNRVNRGTPYLFLVRKSGDTIHREIALNRGTPSILFGTIPASPDSTPTRD